MRGFSMGWVRSMVPVQRGRGTRTAIVTPRPDVACEAHAVDARTRGVRIMGRPHRRPSPPPQR